MLSTQHRKPRNLVSSLDRHAQAGWLYPIRDAPHGPPKGCLVSFPLRHTRKSHKVRGLQSYRNDRKGCWSGASLCVCRAGASLRLLTLNRPMALAANATPGSAFTNGVRQGSCWPDFRCASPAKQRKRGRSLLLPKVYLDDRHRN